MSAPQLPARPARILVSAVEPSGDVLGAALIRELRALAPSRAPQGLVVSGIGGADMAAEGVESAFPIERLSVMGLTDAVRALPEAMRRARDLARLAQGADAAVLIDSWGFHALAAKRIRALAPSVRLIKYVAPQVWASRPKRAATLARLFDGVLSVLPFDAPLLERAGARARFVGNPAFQAAAAQTGDGEAFRARHGLVGDARVLCVLPGSRRSEVRRLAGVFGEAVARLAASRPDLRVVVPAAPAVADAVARAVAAWTPAPVIVPGAERFDAFAASDAALAASGTVTTELALSGTPMAVGYRVDALTGWWVRRVMTAPYATILNVAAGRMLIPEFLQGACTPDALAYALTPLLDDTAAREEQTREFAPLFDMLGVSGPPAARRAAEAVFDWLET